MFTVDAYPERRFDGTVSQIRKAPEISQNVVSYSVVIDASNPEELMFPGMTALIEIVTAQHDQVLQVPNAALRFEMPLESQPDAADPVALDPISPSVWLVRGNSDYERQQLQIGYSDGEFTEIRSGTLTAGDEVIVGYRH
jgi:HlyD family secretion protein